MKKRRQKYQERTGEQTIFHTVCAGRKSAAFSMVTDLIFKLSSYPSYIAECFLRRKFGERYFTFSVAVIIFILMLFPIFFMGSRVRGFVGLPWILFAAAFLYKAIRHRMGIKRFGITYNFDRFSYTDGEMLPFWSRLIGKKILGITITRYTIFIYFEPGLPILIGLFLGIIPWTMVTGTLIFWSGIFFGYRNMMKVYYARDYILDKSDEQIIAKMQHDVIMEQKPKAQTAGLSFPIELPEDRAIRQRMLDDTIELQDDIWEE